MNDRNNILLHISFSARLSTKNTHKQTIEPNSKEKNSILHTMYLFNIVVDWIEIQSNATVESKRKTETMLPFTIAWLWNMNIKLSLSIDKSCTVENMEHH